MNTSLPLLVLNSCIFSIMVDACSAGGGAIKPLLEWEAFACDDQPTILSPWKEQFQRKSDSCLQMNVLFRLQSESAPSKAPALIQLAQLTQPARCSCQPARDKDCAVALPRAERTSAFPRCYPFLTYVLHGAEGKFQGNTAFLLHSVVHKKAWDVTSLCLLRECYIASFLFAAWQTAWLLPQLPG